MSSGAAARCRRCGSDRVGAGMTPDLRSGGPVLVLPGYLNSEREHWQSLWEKASAAFVRVEQRDWERPICAEWVAVLDDAVARHGAGAVLVAHSLACLLVAHWAAITTRTVKGALLVAPPDPENPNFPDAAVGFTPVPDRPFEFPSILVASANDPYATIEFAERCAALWGSRLVNAGALGHINAASGLGEWREGLAQLQRLTA